MTYTSSFFGSMSRVAHFANEKNLRILFILKNNDYGYDVIFEEIPPSIAQIINKLHAEISELKTANDLLQEEFDKALERESELMESIGKLQKMIKEYEE